MLDLMVDYKVVMRNPHEEYIHTCSRFIQNLRFIEKPIRSFHCQEKYGVFQKLRIYSNEFLKLKLHSLLPFMHKTKQIKKLVSFIFHERILSYKNLSNWQRKATSYLLYTESANLEAVQASLCDFQIIFDVIYCILFLSHK